jgi:hypothetical protein
MHSGGNFCSTFVVLACLALAPIQAYAWGGGGGGGPPPKGDPCASLPVEIADAGVIQIDVAPAPFRVAGCDAKAKPKPLKAQKAKIDPSADQKPKQPMLKGNATDYGTGTSQQGTTPSPQDQGTTPQDQGTNPPPPPPPVIPTVTTYDGGASVTGTPQPYVWKGGAMNPSTRQKVWLTLTMNRGPNGQFPQGRFQYQGVPLVDSSGNPIGSANVVVVIRGNQMAVQMSSPFNYSWGRL